LFALMATFAILRSRVSILIERGNLVAIARPEDSLASLTGRWYGWPGVFVLVLAAALALFVSVPGTVEGKSLAVLHGLCAQQAGHSYYFGDARLPFDARMTGIYGGFGLTALYLLARGRWRAAGLPGVPVIVVLALMVIPLALDGTNSFLKDVQAPYVYEPRNAIRTVTGMLTGVSMATFIWLLVGQTAVARGARSERPVWSGIGELALVLSVQVACLGLIATTWAPLRLPLTFLLILSAAGVLTGLLLPFVLLALRRENVARDAWELAGPATLALLLAFAVMAITAGGRFFAEAMLGAPSQIPA
jgi:uncharacterized membrane protein